MEMTTEGMIFAERLQRQLPTGCDRVGLVCDTADIVRLSPVTGIQDGGHTSGFDGLHLEFRYRPTSDNVDRVIYELGMVGK